MDFERVLLAPLPGFVQKQVVVAVGQTAVLGSHLAVAVGQMVGFGQVAVVVDQTVVLGNHLVVAVDQMIDFEQVVVTDQTVVLGKRLVVTDQTVVLGNHLKYIKVKKQTI